MADQKVNPKVYLKFLVLLWLLLLYMPAYFYDFNFDHSSYLTGNENDFLIFWFTDSSAFLLLLFLIFVGIKLKDKFSLGVLAVNGLVNIFCVWMFWKNFIH